MASMIVQLEDTGDIEWFVVLLNGATSIPVLGRQRAAGRLRFLRDQELVEALFDAKHVAETTMRIAADEAILLQDLKAFFDAEAWLRLNYCLNRLNWDEGREVNVTKRFHSENDPQVYLLDDTADAYLLCPSAQANPIIIRIGEKAVAEALTQSWNGSSSSDRSGP